MNFVSGTFLTAQQFIDFKYFMPDKRLDLCICKVNKTNANAVCGLISKYYGNINVLFNNAVVPIESVGAIDFCGENKIVVSAQNCFKLNCQNLTDLMLIMKRLTADDGCLWDKAQTHQSIRLNLIEEAYELLEGLNLLNKDIMIEESGDVILQSVFHSVIAENNGEFDIYDVLNVLCNKLLTRHTHIFGEDVATNQSEALQFWEKAKGKEKNQLSCADKMQAVATTLPALIMAQKLQSIGERAGLVFDKNNLKNELIKTIESLKPATESSGPANAKFEQACGNLLFNTINYLRKLGADSEVALNIATSEYKNDFIKLENFFKTAGENLKEVPGDEINKVWQKLKGGGVYNV